MFSFFGLFRRGAFSKVALSRNVDNRFFFPSFEGFFFKRGRDHQAVKVAFVVWKSGLDSLKLTASESLPLKIGLFLTPEKWKGFI